MLYTYKSNRFLKKKILYILSIIILFFSKFSFSTINQNSNTNTIIYTNNTEKIINYKNNLFIPLQFTQNITNKKYISDKLLLSPTLDKINKKNIDFEAKIAQNLLQIGYILSNKNKNKNIINHAKHLINQHITNSLNQYGKTKIQLDTNKIQNIDFLLPILDKTNNILFTQLGFRKTKDRNITNIGIGYRKYKNNLIWGVNTFYDYDIIGRNSRIGIGYELWLDYLKFTNNGYFNLTNWHQSNLHDMKDYNERPAKGFDFIAEGYLPSYKQFTAFAKYEHYFYKKINENYYSYNGFKPRRSILGISYTPIPLITLKGETSNSKTKNNLLNLEINYRFGLQLSKQLNPNNIDIIRNLFINKYDFIDRNYTIAMEYQKQELLVISLPNFITTENYRILPISATIHKSKYKLKDIFWSSPELTAKGVKIEKISLNSINLILPKFPLQENTTETKKYRLSAIAIDDENNQSNTAITWIHIKQPQKMIKSLILSPNIILPANNKNYYTATIVTQNEKGEALVNQDVTFTITDFIDNTKIILNNLKNETRESISAVTDINGKALIKIKSEIPGEGTLTASIKNESFYTKKLKFKKLINKDYILKLSLIQNKAIANGKEKNIVIATVKDKYENPIKNILLNISATNGALITQTSQTTNDNGQITIQFTNTNIGESILTIRSIENTKSISTQFISNSNEVKISSIKLLDKYTNKVANNTNTFTYMVTVVDNNGKAAANEVIIPFVNKENISIKSNNTTNNNGQTILTLSNSTKEVKDIIVSAQLKTSSIITIADKIVSFNLSNIKGFVTNAINDTPLNKVKINIYSHNEILLDTIYTDHNGFFKIKLCVGNYTLKFFLKGYIDLNRNITVSDDSEMNFPMSPILGNYSGRITLNWDKKPNDLDAHLYVPIKNNSDRIEVFFDQKEPYMANATLDIDKQHLPGVETISLLKFNNGKYLYFVHNCDNSPSDGNLEANVTINLNDGQTKTFTPPALPIKARECWIVFELDTRSDISIINTINLISICP
ncbi:Putative Invasin [Candidatus Providencia siddallii]|uniref:Putative Invasin n=1 Tax=Candidatus Providencia siddallii TaxID=1715285 RepID=A0A0M6WAR8_9GAMM|nr:Putative Invasin [Candidatus Providencia siddallii]